MSDVHAELELIAFSFTDVTKNFDSEIEKKVLKVIECKMCRFIVLSPAKILIVILIRRVA